MSDTTSLGDRMKEYERVTTSQKLMSRTPIIIRLDGKAFHTYTKGCKKPYDRDLHEVRQHTLMYLCENIQGVVFGYSQSDELSLVLKDWDTFQTQGWFDNKLQKLCSVSASMCTAYWNERVLTVTYGLHNKVSDVAIFDSRVFNLPKEEVVNYLVWRQQDWERNSVQMLAQSLYSHKELQGLSCKQLVTKVEEEHDIVWGNLPTHQKRGEFWIRGEGLVDTPIFKDSRQELEQLLYKQGE
jgi:tRNA(His) 5'-end guanylyltransferase